MCRSPVKFKLLQKPSMNDFAVVILVNINNKQLLDEVFVISRIIKVEVKAVSRSRNNKCFIIH